MNNDGHTGFQGRLYLTEATIIKLKGPWNRVAWTLLDVRSEQGITPSPVYLRVLEQQCRARFAPRHPTNVCTGVYCADPRGKGHTLILPAKVSLLPCLNQNASPFQRPHNLNTKKPPGLGKHPRLLSTGVRHTTSTSKLHVITYLKQCWPGCEAKEENGHFCLFPSDVITREAFVWPRNE